MIEFILNIVAILSISFILYSFAGKKNEYINRLFILILFIEVFVLTTSIYLPINLRPPELYSRSIVAPLMLVFIFIGYLVYLFYERVNIHGLVLGYGVLGLTGALFRIISY